MACVGFDGKFYVYFHRRLDNNEIFYVGKGQGNRAWSTKDRSSEWKAIHDRAGGFIVEIVSRWEEEWTALIMEKCWIKSHVLWHHELANKTYGGEGVSGKKRTQEQKEHLRKINMGKRHSETSKRKLRERSHDPKWVAKHREATIKASNTETAKLKHKEKQRSQYKPVVGTNIETGEKLYLEYSSQDMRFDPTRIRACCLKKRKSHRGYT